MLGPKGWCSFLGGLGSGKLEQEGSVYQQGFNLAGEEGSHARDKSSELLARMMLGKMFQCRGLRKYIDRGGAGF